MLSRLQNNGRQDIMLIRHVCRHELDLFIHFRIGRTEWGEGIVSLTELCRVIKTECVYVGGGIGYLTELYTVIRLKLHPTTPLTHKRLEITLSCRKPFAGNQPSS